MISKITETLYIGEYADVVRQTQQETQLRFEQLKALGVGHVLSLCSEGVESCQIENEFKAFNANRKYAIMFHQKPVPDMMGRYEVGFKLALKEINNIFFNNPNAKILIHCLGGIDRAPFLVAAYMVRSCHLDLADAYKLIKKGRSSVIEHPEWAWWTIPS
jgi:protein-tyrosine phosphatase